MKPSPHGDTQSTFSFSTTMVAVAEVSKEMKLARDNSNLRSIK